MIPLAWAVKTAAMSVERGVALGRRRRRSVSPRRWMPRSWRSFTDSPWSLRCSRVGFSLACSRTIDLIARAVEGRLTPRRSLGRCGCQRCACQFPYRSGDVTGQIGVDLADFEKQCLAGGRERAAELIDVQRTHDRRGDLRGGFCGQVVHASALGGGHVVPETGQRKASRGGSWRHQIKVARCSARSSIPPEFQYADYGFRVACD